MFLSLNCIWLKTQKFLHLFLIKQDKLRFSRTFAFTFFTLVFKHFAKLFVTFTIGHLINDGLFYTFSFLDLNLA